eukprot:12021213-Alexandrium_andersonii.AAC.1
MTRASNGCCRALAELSECCGLFGCMSANRFQPLQRWPDIVSSEREALKRALQTIFLHHFYREVPR